MKRTYLFCDKCGVGHAHKLPRPGKDQRSLANCFNWTKTQYVKFMKVLCEPCQKAVNKNEARNIKENLTI